MSSLVTKHLTRLLQGVLGYKQFLVINLHTNEVPVSKVQGRYRDGEAYQIVRCCGAQGRYSKRYVQVPVE